LILYRSGGTSVITDLPSCRMCQNFSGHVASSGNRRERPTIAIGSDSGPDSSTRVLPFGVSFIGGCIFGCQKIIERGRGCLACEELFGVFKPERDLLYSAYHRLKTSANITSMVLACYCGLYPIASGVSTGEEKDHLPYKITTNFYFDLNYGSEIGGHL